MAELAKMYPPQANTPETSLSGALTAAGTTVNVVDGTMLPDAPNLLTIGADGSTAETVLMTEKSGNVLTVVRGQDGTTARAWSAGDVIGRYFTAADQKAMQDNITALNNGKTEKVTSPTDGNLVAFDGTTGKQKDSGKKPGDFAAASHTHSGYVEKVSSPVSGNLVAFDGTTGKQKDSGKKPGDFAAASHSHSGYAQALIFQNVSVAASAWRSDSTYAAYPYAATLTLTGVTASHVPEVTFGAAEAASGIYAPVALSGSGTVKIYAASKPAAAITLQAILCIKAV
jgi:hypothetical protein